MQGAIVNEDGTVNSTSNPARAGSIVAIYGTGGGSTNPAGAAGMLAPFDPLGFLSLSVTVNLDGAQIEVPYAGTAPGINSGVFQMNLRLPDAVGPDAVHLLDVKIGDQSSDPRHRVTIAIQ
jgi:uncharacterized protein (TIGR03437 family)